MSAEWEALRERTRLIRNTEAEIRRLLIQAAADVARLLTQQPSDYQSWYLPQIQAQLSAALERWGDEAADEAGNGQREAWREGSNLIDLSIGAQTKDLGISVRMVLPVIDDAQLRAMNSFLTSKISGITIGAMDAINTDLGLVIMGAKSPWDAIKSVQATLEEDVSNRAGTIVRTELARAYSTAGQERMNGWTDQVSGLEKEWLRSNKMHPRPRHIAMNGQLRPIDKPFDIPGGGTIRYPHDPTAPAAETINCGCVSVPRVPGWKSTASDIGGDDRKSVSAVSGRSQNASSTINVWRSIWLKAQS